MVSIKDVAAHCGVSVATVSKALNDHTDISEATKVLVRKAADELALSPSTVSHYARTWEAEHGRYLPRRGVIHDIGPTLTHKRQIVRMIVLEGRKVEDVCRAMDHSPEAAHRYLKAFKQVLLCHQKGFTTPEISYAVKISQRLVREYLNLIEELAHDNRALKALLNETPLQ